MVNFKAPTDFIVSGMYMDLADHVMKSRETIRLIKETLMHVRYALAVIFFMLFIKLLLEVCTAEWYIGICDGSITCGVFAIFVYIYDLGRRL